MEDSADISSSYSSRQNTVTLDEEFIGRIVRMNCGYVSFKTETFRRSRLPPKASGELRCTNGELMRELQRVVSG